MRGKIKTIYIASALLIMMVLGIIGLVYFAKNENTSPFSQVLSAKDSALVYYYPKWLPNDYKIDKNTISQSGGQLSYAATSEDGNSYFFSIQNKPRQTVVTNFESVQLTGASAVKSPIGSAVVGVANGQTIASITTAKEWILISAPPGSSSEILFKIIQNFKKLE